MYEYEPKNEEMCIMTWCVLWHEQYAGRYNPPSHMEGIKIIQIAIYILVEVGHVVLVNPRKSSSSDSSSKIASNVCILLPS